MSAGVSSSDAIKPMMSEISGLTRTNIQMRDRLSFSLSEAINPINDLIFISVHILPVEVNRAEQQYDEAAEEAYPYEHFPLRSFECSKRPTHGQPF